MFRRIFFVLGGLAVLFWLIEDASAGRGGRGGGGRGGGGARGGGGMRGGGGRAASRPAVNRSPSFSQPRAAQRPAQRPANIGAARPGTRPSTPGSRPGMGVGSRPPVGGQRPGQLPSGGIGQRPGQLPSGGIGQRPGQLPSGGVGQRPGQLPGGGIGQRPGQLPSGGIGQRPGTLPGLGAGAAIGAGIANRPSQRPSLPGLGGDRPGLDRPTNPQERRDNLQSRLEDSRDRGDRQDRRDDRQEGRTERRDDRQEGRTDRRDDRQDRLNDRHEDWQDWRNDYYGHYGDWYHGCWNGNWDNWWDHMWDEHPLAMGLGLTRWGLNRMGYWYGFPWYENWYQNPYYEAAPAPVYDYSQPIIIAPEQTVVMETAEVGALPPTATQPGVDKFDEARAAFYAGDYEQALKFTDDALALMPKDAVLHEFRALALFALKRYSEAAAVIHAVMAVSPGWDWTTVASLYSNVDTYTSQLRALESYRDSQPESAGVRLLLGYHYLILSAPNEAARELKRASELQPKDAVAAEYVRMLSPPAEQPATPRPTTTTGTEAIPHEKVTGTWTAPGKGSAKYSMSLTKEGNFTWSYTTGARKQEVRGVYALDGSSLAMEPTGGGTLLVELTLRDANSMQFQVVGAPAGEPALQFKRNSTP